ncbi:MAG: SMP-30/gluconolactonase/LRE family protein [Alphaproteobacteria bacterium]|nr:SMP-30/gluconolactonase/LRE family protein [Alphaproteobacteria bacterium]
MIKIILLVATLWIGAQISARAAPPGTETVAADLQFPEGTIFIGDNLYFVDYARSVVLRLAGGRTEVVWQQPGCGANGLLTVPDGLLVACFDSGRIVEIAMSGATLATIRQDDRGQPFAAPNDLAADRNGGVYFTASGSAATPGKVFHLGRDRVVREVASGIQFANGVGLSPDGRTLFVAETPTGKVLAVAIRADGSLGAPQDFIRLRDAVAAGRSGAAKPDSLRVDRHGNLFVALYEGGGVAIVSPAGRLLTVVDVPAAHHTNLAISPDEKWLYVTAVDDDPRSTYRGYIVRVVNPLAP